MVVINFTLLVELGLFLIFLWGTAVFILRPVLRLLDEREDNIARGRRQADEALEKEGRLRKQSADARSAFRSRIEKDYRRGQLEVREEHSAKLTEERRKSDAAIAEARDAALKEIEAERSSYAALSSELADSFFEHLGMRQET